MRRRSIRLRGYDYRRNGIYFVTICAYKKMKLFGEIADGEMARDEWQHISLARSNVQLDQFVVMPNHLHGVVIIEEMRDCGAGQKNPAATKKQISAIKAGSLGAIISQFKAAVSRSAWSGLIDRDRPIWQRNYYDHIVRNEESLNEIRRYIIENPARWAEDSQYVD